MSKHNFYPVELKIQIIERFLNGEITSLESSSGRRLEKDTSVSEQLDKVTKELNLLKKYFSQERG